MVIACHSHTTDCMKGHVKGARHVDYDDMFSKPMMEELNKRDNLIIIHDVPEAAGAIALTLKVMDYPRIYILKQVLGKNR